jgi:alpha-tubulin suppressor-like RCC1 family protein
MNKVNFFFLIFSLLFQHKSRAQSITYKLQSLATKLDTSCVVASPALVTPGTSPSKTYCWGKNDSFQLGLANGTPYSHTPQAINFSGLVTSSNPTPHAYQLAVGNKHVCGILNDSTVACWGNHDLTYRQLGNGATPGFNYAIPSRVKINSTTNLSGVRAISAGRFHTCAVVAPSGEVYCWGDYANLSRGDSLNASTAIYANKVRLHSTTGTYPFLSSMTRVVAGFTHSCAINSSGSLFCWGSNEYGQLANHCGTIPSPSNPVTGNYCRALQSKTGVTNSVFLSNVSKVAIGQNSSCVVRTSGEILCIGANNHGQLGDNNPASGIYSFPMSSPVPAYFAHSYRYINTFAPNGWGSTYFSNSMDISASNVNSTFCATKNSSSNLISTACWGNFQSLFGINGSISLGVSNVPVGRVWNTSTSTFVDQFNYSDYFPRLISFPTTIFGTTSLPGQIVVGNGHACQIIHNGGGDMIGCWGKNNFGQLGTSVIPNVTLTPVKVNL